MSTFEYFSSNDTQPDASIVVPPGITKRGDLLSYFSRMLAFPPCFEGDWDGFEACLCDLSWLREPSLTIVHYDLPPLDGEQRGTYVGALRAAVSDGHKPVKVFFPDTCKASIEALCREPRTDD